MSIFDLHKGVVSDYRNYVQSFLAIADDRVRVFVENEVVAGNVLWPEPLLQLNPVYEFGSGLAKMAENNRIDPLLLQIFTDEQGKPIRLYRHQEEAIEQGLQDQSFVVTSGTGSGKTLTYFVPIFNAILKGNHAEPRVWAIIAYPMNALVNSQFDALTRLAESFTTRTKKQLPVRFKKYTGQERDIEKRAIQASPPHILLTNYVMLELMLVRPEERAFVDRTASNLQFLVVDELHTHRGRQGADVAMLVRRLRERAGNPKLICIGTSATMVAGKTTTSQERKQAVANFAGKIFGVPLKADNVIEEYLQPIAIGREPPTKEQLIQALNKPFPQTAGEAALSPLTAWLENAFGLDVEEGGTYRRKTPTTIESGAALLSEITDEDPAKCEARLLEAFLRGSQLRSPEFNPLFAFKIHQFITQGRNVYATLEKPAQRYLTLEGQYYGPEGRSTRLLFPLVFCRVCGQEYYVVQKNEEGHELAPFELVGSTFAEGETQVGYVMMPPEDAEVEWSAEHLPEEWLAPNGRVKSSFRDHIPEALWVQPDGSFTREEKADADKAWFQRRPFMLCLNCGEFFTGRDKNDFRKLAGLSSEGRSTATTVLTSTALLQAPEGGIPEGARKILSFTDNRQDASLQAGHFNDFIKTSLIRSAIVTALRTHKYLDYTTISQVVTGAMGLRLSDVAANRTLHPDSPQARDLWKVFQDLIELRIYEDLRRGWRVVQPNLEQCGLLRIEYKGLAGVCERDDLWAEVPVLSECTPQDRFLIARTILDHFRRKLAIQTGCLAETQQQQLQKKVSQQINEKWGFDEGEYLHTATRFLLPGQRIENVDGLSLSANSLIGRCLKKTLRLAADAYLDVLGGTIDYLCGQGFLRKGTDRGIDFVQLDAAILQWTEGDGAPPPPDPIYSRRVTGPAYIEAERKSNVFFSNFYEQTAARLVPVEGREHTAQVGYDEREAREKAFREGTLPCLFCSPTMELGIDIADLHMVHLRNVPPTPANYAQRSGRAGRKGDPAFVMTYCAAGSGHDQYFFHHRDEMVAGVVRPPRIDLSNEELVKAHLHAVWLAEVGLHLGVSVSDLVDPRMDDLSLNENAKAQTHLSQPRLEECIASARQVLSSCEPDLSEPGWYSEEWLSNVFIRAPEAFDRALDRWRELYKAADRQWEEANRVLRFPVRDRRQREEAETLRREAERQKNLLCNIGTRDESDFYPYRYLASEGFLPGYNFPRLPVRAFIPRNDGEFISRPRFLGITEFGPKNIVYHEGAKYLVGKLISPPGGLQTRRSQAKLCRVCGYFQSDSTNDLCEHCATRLDAANCDVVPLLEMPNVKTRRRERITSDEEERLRFGYNITTHIRFAPGPGGTTKVTEARVCDAAETPLFRLVYAPAAELFRVSHGWRNRREQGFAIDLATGEWLTRVEPEGDEVRPDRPRQPDVVHLFVKDTENILLLYPLSDGLQWTDEMQASLQYALQRGIEQVFQVEESEIASERIGAGPNRAILYWEASEGGVGVLRRLVDEPEMIGRVAEAALERCHFNPETLADLKEGCIRACYECLLSYSNQRDYPRLNRRILGNVLGQLRSCRAFERQGGRDYEEHYRWLRSLTDSRSDLERRFIDRLYQTKRRLPDEAQKALADYYSIPDFFYQPNVCVFCDGSVHDEPTQKEKDDRTRAELKELGYRIIVIRYDRGLDEQIDQYADIFGGSPGGTQGT